MRTLIALTIVSMCFCWSEDAMLPHFLEGQTFALFSRSILEELESDVDSVRTHEPLSLRIAAHADHKAELRLGNSLSVAVDRITMRFGSRGSPEFHFKSGVVTTFLSVETPLLYHLIIAPHGADDPQEFFAIDHAVWTNAGEQERLRFLIAISQKFKSSALNTSLRD